MINHNRGDDLPVKHFLFKDIIRKNGRLLVAFEAGGANDLDGTAVIRTFELSAEDIAEYIRREYKSMLFWAEKSKALKKEHPQQSVFKKVLATLQANIDQFIIGKKEFDKALLGKI